MIVVVNTISFNDQCAFKIPVCMGIQWLQEKSSYKNSIITTLLLSILILGMCYVRT